MDVLITVAAGFVALFAIVPILYIFDKWPWGRKERKMSKDNSLADRVEALEDAAARADYYNRLKSIDPLLKRAMSITALDEDSGVTYWDVFHPARSMLHLQALERIQRMLDAGLLRMLQPANKGE